MRLFTVAVVVSLAAACAPDPTPPGVGGDPPGSKPWTSDDVACTDKSDSSVGETCLDGVCQMERCAADFASTAPLGTHRYFLVDSELAVVGDHSYVDGFEDDYLGSWDLSGFVLTDVAGGDLTGTRPHALAVGIEGLSGVRVQSGEGESTLDLSFEPVGLGVGEVDGDGVDELVALSGSSLAVCHVDAGACEEFTLDGADLQDLALADVDGDGYAEVIALEVQGGESLVYVWNVDAATTGDDALLVWSLNKAAFAVAAGDVDADGRAEVLLLEDGGYWGWVGDRLHVFSPSQEQVLTSADVDGGTVDLAAADRDNDGKLEVYVLRDDRSVDALVAEAGSLVVVGQTQLAVGTTAQKITTLDWDGDSPSGRLLSGPELIAGETVPVALLVVPPSDLDLSDGFGRTTLGNSESQTVTESEMLSLGVGLVVSYGADLGSIAKAKVQAQFERETSVTKAVAEGISIGQSYAIAGDESMVGGPQAGVVLSCGCFHHYRYETEDPAGLLGSTSASSFDVLVPVGGQSGLFSLSRYNRMAEKLGTLPIIPLESRIGDVASYPTQPLTLDGQSIPQEDVLFPELPPMVVSDVGKVGWSASVRESETNTAATTTRIGFGGSLGAFGVEVSGNVYTRFQTAYSLAVGFDTSFSGDVPPILDSPKTPEDEFLDGRYSFAPVVYRQHYENAAGEDAAFYVIDYVVAP